MIHSFTPRAIKRKWDAYKLGYRLVTSPKSYLVQVGYVNSRLNKKLLDEDNDLVPWMNYPFIELLKERLNGELTVFEYGSGASTVFFAKRVKTIVSVEYDRQWFDRVETLLAGYPNARVIFNEADETYPLLVKNRGERFDVIVIDGRKRVKCAKAALESLAERGVLVLDDSQREYYREVFSFYQSKGYSHLRFVGLKPGGFTKVETTIFYKPGNNCFGI